MPKKVDHAARRSELAAAVLEVVAREGMDGATIRGVAAQAGWTRGVVAHYFDSRDDLLLFAYREGLARTRSMLEDVGERSSYEVLRAWLLLNLPLDDASTLNHAIYLGFAGSATRRPELAAAVEAETDELDRCTRELLRRCIDEGHLTPPFALAVAADVLCTFVDGLGLHLVTNPSRGTAKDAERMLEAFLDSWRPRCVL